MLSLLYVATLKMEGICRAYCFSRGIKFNYNKNIQLFVLYTLLTFVP